MPLETNKGPVHPKGLGRFILKRKKKKCYLPEQEALSGSACSAQVEREGASVYTHLCEVALGPLCPGLALASVAGQKVPSCEQSPWSSRVL